MIRTLRILPTIFEVLDNESTLFRDEIQNRFHPKLTKLLINLFNYDETSSYYTQLSCTTYNTQLLNKIRINNTIEVKYL